MCASRRWYSSQTLLVKEHDVHVPQMSLFVLHRTLIARCVEQEIKGGGGGWGGLGEIHWKLSA